MDGELRAGGFDLVITDHDLRWANGLTILDEVKRSDPLVPVIMFTSSGSEEIAVEAMKQGLDDYVLKTDLARLPGAVRIAFERATERRVLAVSAEALERSESRLRALLSSMSEVVIVLDSEGRYLDISSRDADLLYQPAGELKGKILHEVFPPEQAEFFLDHVRRALSTRATVPCEYELDIEGRETWFAALVSPMSQEQVVWVARDITERKEAELALRSGEAKFRALFEAGADAFLLVGADGSIEMINRRAETLFGYSREELQGQPLNMLVPEGLRTKHEKDMRDFVEKPKTRPMHSGLELWGMRKDGTTFPAEISLSYVTTETGVLAMAAVTDETERKRAEDALRESLTRLRKSDAERGRLLASLVVAQEEERGRMARELHDDAIQVMTAAELRLQTLAIKDPALAEALNALGETIQNAIGRLRTSLIGLRPPILENVGVASALRAHLATMREHSFLDFTISDLWEREPGLETRVTVYRIVLEALTNVRKHADATSVDITLKPVDGGFGASVRDNGKGFDSTAAAEGAPGHMGLMIMRERTELSGGKLDIVSRPGRGTTVEFWVPDVPDETPEEGGPA